MNTESIKIEASSPYLHIAIHGKKDKDPNVEWDSDIEIGTLNGQACDKKTRDWFAQRLAEELAARGIKIGGQEVDIKTDVHFVGDMTKIMGPKDHGNNYKNDLPFCRIYLIQKMLQSIYHDLSLRKYN